MATASTAARARVIPSLFPLLWRVVNRSRPKKMKMWDLTKQTATCTRRPPQPTGAVARRRRPVRVGDALGSGVDPPPAPGVSLTWGVQRGVEGRVQPEATYGRWKAAKMESCFRGSHICGTQASHRPVRDNRSWRLGTLSPVGR